VLWEQKYTDIIFDLSEFMEFIFSLLAIIRKLRSQRLDGWEDLRVQFMFWTDKKAFANCCKISEDGHELSLTSTEEVREGRKGFFTGP
jgi:hypothetical protein